MVVKGSEFFLNELNIKHIVNTVRYMDATIKNKHTQTTQTEWEKYPIKCPVHNKNGEDATVKPNQRNYTDFLINNSAIAVWSPFKSLK